MSERVYCAHRLGPNVHAYGSFATAQAAHNAEQYRHIDKLEPQSNGCVRSPVNRKMATNVPLRTF